MEYSLTKPEFAIPPPTQRTRVRRFIKRFKPSPDSPAPACAQCLDDPEQNGHIVAEPAAADVGTMIRTSVEDSTAQEDEQNDPYNNAHDDGHVDSEPITEVQANTDEDERVRAELSIKSLEVCLQKTPSFEAADGFKDFRFFRFGRTPKITAYIKKKLPRGLLLDASQVARILPMPVIRNCNAKVHALQNKTNRILQKKISPLKSLGLEFFRHGAPGHCS
ncbi:hypothetical protein JG687_00000438 [Phytophthora cactorum]|uniref:Uncharacterized protein n=1 Tax=Phytophthora cactorum TaxID=29920 RepID=A0A8T1V2U2_9STRA|nr:hypothetical protein JG687_00000438 [Phytophthora cactorum]